MTAKLDSHFLPSYTMRMDSSAVANLVQARGAGYFEAGSSSAALAWPYAEFWPDMALPPANYLCEVKGRDVEEAGRDGPEVAPPYEVPANGSVPAWFEMGETPCWVGGCYLAPDHALAPSDEVWAGLSRVQRDFVSEWLDEEYRSRRTDMGHLLMSASVWIQASLKRHFESIGRLAFVPVELGVHFAKKQVLCPDAMVLMDEQPDQPVSEWRVDAGRKVPDVCFEVASSSIAYDIGPKRERYESHKIPEYFILCLADGPVRLLGYQFNEALGKFVELETDDDGRLRSDVMGLQLKVEGTKIRFYYRGEPVLTPDEQRAKEKERADKEKERADKEAARRMAAEQQLQAALRKIAEMQEQSDIANRQAPPPA